MEQFRQSNNIPVKLVVASSLNWLNGLVLSAVGFNGARLLPLYGHDDRRVAPVYPSLAVGN